MYLFQYTYYQIQSHTLFRMFFFFLFHFLGWASQYNHDTQSVARNRTMHTIKKNTHTTTTIIISQVHFWPKRNIIIKYATHNKMLFAATTRGALCFMLRLTYMSFYRIPPFEHFFRRFSFWILYAYVSRACYAEHLGDFGRQMQN